MFKFKGPEFNDKAGIDFLMYVENYRKLDLPYEVLLYIYHELGVKTIGEFMDKFILYINKVQKKFPEITDEYLKEHCGTWFPDTFIDITVQKDD